MIVLRSGRLLIPGGLSFGFTETEEVDSLVTGVEAPAMMGKKRQQMPSRSYGVEVTQLSQAQAELIANAFKQSLGAAGVLIFQPDTGPAKRVSFREDSLQIRYAGDGLASVTFELEADPR
jgi:hypothetical protein